MAEFIQSRITADEYFQLPEYQTATFIQLIDGEVVVEGGGLVAMPPILKHQRLVRTIFALLLKIAETKGGEPWIAATEVYLDAKNIFEPDLFYLTTDSKCQEDSEGKRLIGAPDLVVEILSPSTARYDKQQKYQAYEKHGVREYWIVDPLHDILDVWTLDAEGHFQRLGSFAGEDSFQSSVLEESISVKAIFSI